jgi:hypothetical protein
MIKLFPISLLGLLLVTGLIVFQANSPDNRQFDDNNPYIDQPTREAYSHFHAMHYENIQDIITDVQGFDNFDITLDQAEQHLTSNPNNPLWMFFGVNVSPLGARNTTNGGLNWTILNPQYPGGSCCDPWSAYTGNGVLIYGTLHTSFGQHVYTSTNNGNTWTAAVLSVNGNDRNTLAAEESGTGPYANYIYAAITPGNFARSTDLGATWTTTYSNGNNIPGVMIAVGPNGSTNGGSVIYVTNTGATQNVTYTFQRSTDGGATFNVVSNIFDAGYVGTLNGVGRLVINNARTRPYPMIAYDNSNGTYRGRLYCVYASNDPPGNGNKPDIILKYSTDHGSTWSARIKVNDDPNSQNVDNWFPAIWCERTTGKLYIKWYDDRENPATYTTGVWATYSTDGGATFAPNQRISNATFTYPCPGCPPDQNCYRGDYDGMTANPNVGFAVWYDPRNCSYLTVGSYFPDFAMLSRPALDTLTNLADTTFYWVSVPAVKLYSNSVRFSAAFQTPPGSGTVTFTFLNKTSNTLQDSLTTYPDSLRLRVISSGGVTTGLYTIQIKGFGPNGTPVHRRDAQLRVINPIGIISLGNEIPNEFYLYQNFPNPFNPTANIRFDIAKAGNVRLVVYDVTGKQVAELINERYDAGKYMTDFNAANLASGIYFYRLVVGSFGETSDFVSIKKMILIK